MSSTGASQSLADRLLTACFNDDLPSVKAAVADGASVNEEGTAPDSRTYTPLAAAIFTIHPNVVVWLLSHGADPNGRGVMWYGAHFCTTAILQLLIDAGGDFSGDNGGQPPLFAVVRGFNSEDNVRALLAQPCLDCTKIYCSQTTEQSAPHLRRLALADVIAEEVSGKGLPVLLGGNDCAACCNGVWRCCG